MIYWILYAMLEGYREGNYWGARKTIFPYIDFHEHKLWSSQRFAVLSIVIIHINIVVAIACMFVFPFIHDGMYYLRRNMLDPDIYPKGFFDQSTTSTAILTKFFTPMVRTVCAVIGIAIYLLSDQIIEKTLELLNLNY